MAVYFFKKKYTAIPSVLGQLRLPQKCFKPAIAQKTEPGIMQELARRTATGVVFVLVMITGIYSGRWGYSLLFTAVTSLSLWEFLYLVLDRKSRRDRIRKNPIPE